MASDLDLTELRARAEADASLQAEDPNEQNCRWDPRDVIELLDEIERLHSAEREIAELREMNVNQARRLGAKMRDRKGTNDVDHRKWIVDIMGEGYLDDAAVVEVARQLLEARAALETAKAQVILERDCAQGLADKCAPLIQNLRGQLSEARAALKTAEIDTKSRMAIDLRRDADERDDPYEPSSSSAAAALRCAADTIDPPPNKAIIQGIEHGPFSTLILGVATSRSRLRRPASPKGADDGG